jgi:hypothetical protein
VLVAILCIAIFFVAILAEQWKTVLSDTLMLKLDSLMDDAVDQQDKKLQNEIIIFQHAFKNNQKLPEINDDRVKEILDHKLSRLILPISFR